MKGTDLSTLIEFTKRVIRTGKTLARDERIPNWLRWLFIFGVAPVPLFLDEVALVLAVGILAIAHRALLAEAWERSDGRADA